MLLNIYHANGKACWMIRYLTIVDLHVDLDDLF